MKPPIRPSHDITAQHPEVVDWDLLEGDATPLTLLGCDLPATPERALVAAVILQAMHDARGVAAGRVRPRDRKQYEREAKIWLHDGTTPNLNGGATWGMGFCAQALDWPFEQFLRQISTSTKVSRQRGYVPAQVGRRKHGRRAA